MKFEWKINSIEMIPILNKFQRRRTKKKRESFFLKLKISFLKSNIGKIGRLEVGRN